MADVLFDWALIVCVIAIVITVYGFVAWLVDVVIAACEPKAPRR